MSALPSGGSAILVFDQVGSQTTAKRPFTAAPTSPGQIIRRIIQERGCDDKEFAADLGFTPQHLSMIIKGDRRLTRSKMEELARVTGRSVEEWLRIQNDYAAWKGANDLTDSYFTDSLPTSGILSRQDILRYQTAARIVEPFNEEHVKPASLDLCLGDTRRFRRHPELELKSKNEVLTDTEKRLLYEDRDLAEKKARELIRIKPGETWRIWVMEEINMPETLCGRISVRSDIIMEGITPGYGLQIDPGWNGKPFVILTHNGDEEFDLDLGHECVSVEFRVLSSPYRLTPD